MEEILTNSVSPIDFAEAMDHWGNIGQAIDVLLRNLMWAAPYEVFLQSINILQFIAREATYTQASVILSKLDSSHFDWRNSVEAGNQLQSKRKVPMSRNETIVMNALRYCP